MKNVHFIPIILSSFIFCCGGKDKIDVSAIQTDGELTIQHDPAQTIDSIIIFNTGKIIRNSGDSIYRVITHKEQRRIDSIRYLGKNQGYPINPFSPSVSDMTHQSFTLNENGYFSIYAYDTVGQEVVKFVDDKFSKGIYEVYYAIYSILKPGSYYLKMSSQLVEQYIKLEVN